MDNKYKYTYEKSSSYCYKGTDILINKLNITNDNDLFNFERELVSLRTFELNERPLKGDFDFKHLKSIHEYLFQDVYKWAGNIRTCNIAKQDLFCLSENINSYAKDIFKKLKKEKFFILYDYDIKLKKLVELFSDINALHPFREGNGRTQRYFIETLAKINGINLDLTSVSKNDMVIASHESVNGYYEKLINIFYDNSVALNKEEQEMYLEIYCSIELYNFIKKNLL